MKKFAAIVVLALGLTGCAGATSSPVPDTTAYEPTTPVVAESDVEVYIPSIEFKVPDVTKNPIQPQPIVTAPPVELPPVEPQPEVTTPVIPEQPQQQVTEAAPETQVEVVEQPAVETGNWAEQQLVAAGYPGIVVEFGDTMSLCKADGGCGQVGGPYILMNAKYENAAGDPAAQHVLWHEVAHTQGVTNECEAEDFAHSMTGSTELWSYYELCN